MAECLPQKSAGQMPQILRSHTLDKVTVHQLAEYRFYPIAEASEKRACPWRRVVLGSLERSHKVNLLSGKLLSQSGTPVVSVAQDCAETTGCEFGSDGCIVDVGRGYAEADYDAGPRHQRVQTEAVECLPSQGVVSEGGIAFEAPASVCARELAGWQGDAVDDVKLRVERSLSQYALPYQFLHGAQVGWLPDECGAMHRSYRGKEVRVVALEVIEDSLVLMQTQILTHNFDGEDFVVRERGRWTSLSEASVSLLRDSVHTNC